MIAPLSGRIFNRLLQIHPDYLEQMRPLRGSVIRLQCGATQLAWRVLPSGKVTSVHSFIHPDITVTITPEELNWGSVLADKISPSDEREGRPSLRGVRISGQTSDFKRIEKIIAAMGDSWQSALIDILGPALGSALIEQCYRVSGRDNFNEAPVGLGGVIQDTGVDLAREIKQRFAPRMKKTMQKILVSASQAQCVADEAHALQQRVRQFERV